MRTWRTRCLFDVTYMPVQWLHYSLRSWAYCFRWDQPVNNKAGVMMFRYCKTMDWSACLSQHWTACVCWCACWQHTAREQAYLQWAFQTGQSQHGAGWLSASSASGELHDRWLHSAWQASGCGVCPATPAHCTVRKGCHESYTFSFDSIVQRFHRLSVAGLLHTIHPFCQSADHHLDHYWPNVPTHWQHLCARLWRSACTICDCSANNCRP